MGRTKGATSNRNQEHMLALHAAFRTQDRCGEPLTIPQWETIILAFFGMRSRQSCHDITWGMQRAGMIDWTKGKTVTVLDQDPFILDDEPTTPPELEAFAA